MRRTRDAVVSTVIIATIFVIATAASAVIGTWLHVK